MWRSLSREKDRMFWVQVEGKSGVLDGVVGKTLLTCPASGTYKPEKESSGSKGKEARPDPTGILSPQLILFHPLGASALGSRGPLSVLEQKGVMCGKISQVTVEDGV